METTNMTQINLDTIWQFDLRKGNSDSPRDGACLLDAVSWFEYGKLGDHPPCVSPVYAAYGRAINDTLSDDKRQSLKRFLIRLPGTVDPDSEQSRIEYIVKRTIREILPISLRSVNKISEATLCETLPIDGSMKVYDDAAHVAADAADHCDAAACAAACAADAAACAAACAAIAAADAAAAAARAAACAAVHAAGLIDDAAASNLINTIYDLTIDIFEGMLSIGKQADLDLPRWEVANVSFNHERNQTNAA